MLKLNKIIYYFCGLYKELLFEYRTVNVFLSNPPPSIAIATYLKNSQHLMNLVRYGCKTKTYFHLSDRKLFKFI